MRPCIVIPAFEASRTVGPVIESVRARLPLDAGSLLVVDDGSTDDTARVAEGAGATVLRLPRNGGKGAALVAGMQWALARGFDAALTLDADGQHTAEGVAAVLAASPDAHALVLGVRNLASAGAPKKNRFSNGVSNVFLSLFAGRKLRDTQCGLRRYPLPSSLELGATAKGYAFEAEVLLRAARRSLPLVEVDIEVLYPDDRTTHFDSVRDPMRIIVVVVRTFAAMHRRAVFALAAVLALLAVRALVHAATAPAAPRLSRAATSTSTATATGSMAATERFSQKAGLP